jgi:hypothetical protein
MRKRHSVSLSEDMEQMMATPFSSTHDEITSKTVDNVRQKISSTSMSSTESNRSSSIHSLKSFNEINEKFKY